jgi:hypothetical protein
MKKKIAPKSCNYFNNIQINQKTITNGRQLIRVEEVTDYAADLNLKTENKEDTLRIYCTDDWMESNKTLTTEQQFQKKFAMLLTN